MMIYLLVSVQYGYKQQCHFYIFELLESIQSPYSHNYYILYLLLLKACKKFSETIDVYYYYFVYLNSQINVNGLK